MLEGIDRVGHRGVGNRGIVGVFVVGGKSVGCGQALAVALTHV